ncbi:MAG: hypothetical protein Q7R81_01270 [Candidatus Peregrinibacteria bacterium]|nr:hypothetical protein [Candidatus Peregrinibacteria bacterium]
MPSRSPILNLTFALVAFTAAVLVWQTFLRPAPQARPEEPIVEEECVGEPIVVAYAYEGTVVEPHACLPQCSDDLPRYVLYTNGKATQCEPPPGCNDFGEDTGVTCKVPAMSTL